MGHSEPGHEALPRQPLWPPWPNAEPRQSTAPQEEHPSRAVAENHAPTPQKSVPQATSTSLLVLLPPHAGAEMPGAPHGSSGPNPFKIGDPQQSAHSAPCRPALEAGRWEEVQKSPADHSPALPAKFTHPHNTLAGRVISLSDHIQQ